MSNFENIMLTHIRNILILTYDWTGFEQVLTGSGRDRFSGPVIFFCIRGTSGPNFSKCVTVIEGSLELEN